MIKRFLNWLQRPFLYVIADATDNSVTLSKALFKRMGVMGLDVARVFVFKIPDTENYAFTVNPELEQDTLTADIQYNSKHKCIGFETLCPTVNRIFFDYGLPADVRCKLSVRESKTINLVYYEILKPHGKIAR